MVNNCYLECCTDSEPWYPDKPSCMHAFHARISLLSPSRTVDAKELITNLLLGQVREEFYIVT